MQHNHFKKSTHEDRFARKYYCNPARFMPKIKKSNQKRFRQKWRKESEGEEQP